MRPSLIRISRGSGAADSIPDTVTTIEAASSKRQRILGQPSYPYLHYRLAHSWCKPIGQVVLVPAQDSIFVNFYLEPNGCTGVDLIQDVGLVPTVLASYLHCCYPINDFLFRDAGCRRILYLYWRIPSWNRPPDSLERVTNAVQDVVICAQKRSKM
jgi:hypothetical protein